MNPVARWLDQPPAEWERLLREDPNACASHEPALWRALEQAEGGTRVRLLAIERDGALLGGMPVAILRRAGLAWVHAMPFVLPGAPLSIEGERERVDPACGAALAALQRELGAVGGAWACYRPEGGAPPSAVLEAAGGETRPVETALVTLTGGLDHALRRIDRKTRQALARERRALSFEEDPGALAAGWALHRAQSREWGPRRVAPLELSRRLLEARGSRGACGRCFVVRDRAGVLSMVFALDGGGECLLWWSGTHAAGRARRAFTVLAWSVVEWAAESRRRVNLGASPGLPGVSSFKDSLGAEAHAYPVRWLDARHAALPGRAIGWVQSRLRRAIAGGGRA